MDNSQLPHQVERGESSARPTNPTPPAIDANSASRKKFLCDYCRARFVYKGQMALHIQDKHQDVLRLLAEGKTFNCTLCTKVYRTRQSREQHMANHRNDLEHRCEKCGKGYNNKVYLNAHVKKCTETNYAPNNWPDDEAENSEGGTEGGETDEETEAGTGGATEGESGEQRRPLPLKTASGRTLHPNSPLRR